MNKADRKKRVLFCSSFTPPVNAGGGKNAFNFAKFLSEKDYQVTLLSLNRRGKLPSRSRSGNLIIKRILYFNQNIITKLLSLFIILPNYFCYVLKNDVIFIYGGNIIGYEFIILFGRILRKKVVFRSTMLGEDDIASIVRKNSFWYFGRRWIIGLLDYYFSLNPEFTESFQEIFTDHQKIIQSVQGVDIRQFKPVNSSDKTGIRKKLGIREDLFVIITIGFLIRRKGFKEIFTSLKDLEIPYLYIIVGNYEVDRWHYLYHINHEMNHLYKLGRELLGERILFTGPVENVHEYLQASDVFLLNSKSEGTPNALLEAMACGIPPVINHITGIEQYIVQHMKNSVIFDNPDDIKKAILLLNQDSGLLACIGSEAVNTIHNEMTFEHVLDRLKEHTIL